MRNLNGVWVEESDFRPMGKPESSIELPGEITLGLHIVAPFGPGTDAMLAVHALEDAETPGGTIALAVVEVETPKPMDVTMLSNPRRVRPYSDPRRAKGDDT